MIGETPYAEMMGDRKDLHLTGDDVVAIRNVKNANVPVAVVFDFGRRCFLITY